MGPSLSLLFPLTLFPVQSLSFIPAGGGTQTIRFAERFIISTRMASNKVITGNYPRPIHPGGFSLPPLVEDCLPIITESKDKSGQGTTLQTNLMHIRPPGMEELWEWYAYTKHQSEGDPSWGRVWPTALSLARFITRSFQHQDSDGEYDVELVNQASNALRTTSHVVELGCGLGVAGLAYSSSITSLHGNSQLAHKRTVTFLDREPYALHCVMSSAAMNSFTTAPLQPAEDGSLESSSSSLVTVRAAMDDWTIIDENNCEENRQQIRNIRYHELCLDSSEFNNKDTTIIASDILYEPASMITLANKIKSLLHPQNGGYALISDPKEERTEGCRDAFVTSVKKLEGEIAIMPLPAPQSNAKMVESDIDINGSMSSTVLIVIYFPSCVKK